MFCKSLILRCFSLSVVPLGKGWRKVSHLLSLQFLSNLLVVVMDEVPNRTNVIF